MKIFQNVEVRPRPIHSTWVCLLQQHMRFLLLLTALISQHNFFVAFAVYHNLQIKFKSMEGAKFHLNGAWR